MESELGLILLVEDEMLLREVTREDLSDLGYDVLDVGSADEALPIIESSRPIVAMITDIRMPGCMDGWDLARRAREHRPELPVIYVSGYSDDDIGPVEGGVFLRKPYRFEDLARALATSADP